MLIDKKAIQNRKDGRHQWHLIASDCTVYMKKYSKIVGAGIKDGKLYVTSESDNEITIMGYRNFIVRDKCSVPEYNIQETALLPIDDLVLDGKTVTVFELVKL
ncbi:hypothetical protein [Photobacterium kishitanii]|uniref:Uncharacterized protein n=1 Tax=Photobacterium kishitanii TaxID=318456 RepID=A0A2T3KMD1_9GAMM|nr:hypothetical protein [Photobacterium kishitanii]PSV00956.1 hypothetical protein C9J27_02720 [Photobacterium kishitanii]